MDLSFFCLLYFVQNEVRQNGPIIKCSNMCTAIAKGRRDFCANHLCSKCGTKRSWWGSSSVSDDGEYITFFFVIHLSCSLLLSTVYSNSCQNWCLSSCAVCLDGSPPAYHLHKGFGAGIDNWIVHFEVCPFLQTGINNESLPTHENFWAHLFLFSFSLFTVYYINHWKQKID